MKRRISAAAVASLALALTACGGGKTASRGGTTATGRCSASVGVEVPLSGAKAATGRAQLAFARLAVAQDNAANGTKITLVPGGTSSDPSDAVALTRSLLSNPSLVAVLGPATDPEVSAVGPLLGRAGMAFVSASATATALTSGANPTFFRVVPNQSDQGVQVARFVAGRLRPRAALIIGDRGAYSAELAAAMSPVLAAARVAVTRQSARPGAPLPAARIPARIRVILLPWRSASSAQRLGAALAQQRKVATLVATDRVYAPGRFTVAGSYVSFPAPDITAIPGDGGIVRAATRLAPGFGPLGPPAYAAAHVIDDAIAHVCRSGETASPSDVLAAVRATSQPTSILGEPIRFDGQGNLAGGRWFLFHVDPKGRYVLVRDV